jgi:hypothetical protein
MKASGTLATSCLVCLLTMVGCGETNKITGGAVFDVSSSALTSGTVCAIEGTYGASCTSPSGSGADYAANTHWTILTPGATASFEDGTHEPLGAAVVTDNAACVLSITDVITNPTSCSDTTWADYVDYTAAAPFALGTAFAGSATAFSNSGTEQFYGNFDSAGAGVFSANFTVNMLYSLNDVTSTSNNQATYAVVTSTLSSLGVPVPNAVLNFGGLTLTNDQSQKLQTFGTFTMTNGSVEPTTYVIDATLDDATLSSPTFATVDAAYLAGTNYPLAASAVTLTNSTGAAGLALPMVIGTTVLSQTAYIIVANTVSGVRSYQLFAITFTAEG